MMTLMLWSWGDTSNDEIGAMILGGTLALMTLMLWSWGDTSDDEIGTAVLGGH